MKALKRLRKKSLREKQNHKREIESEIKRNGGSTAPRLSFQYLQTKSRPLFVKHVINVNETKSQSSEFCKSQLIRLIGPCPLSYYVPILVDVSQTPHGDSCQKAAHAQRTLFSRTVLSIHIRRGSLFGTKETVVASQEKINT